VRLADSPADFARDPWGRYWVGRRYVVFSHSKALLGHASWGRPDVDDVREMLDLCAVGLRPDAERHAWLVDLRGLELVLPPTFAPWVAYVRANADVLRDKLVRQAQIRPEGLVGAVISGFSHVARLPYPERVFDAPDDALAWLGVDRALGLELLDEVGAARRAAIARESLVGRLREVLDARGPLPLDLAARAVGASTRSLQRALSGVGTTFRGEIRELTVRRARTMLEEGDRTVAAIASELGFSSVQHFGTAFRRATGETPSAYRARRVELAGAKR